MLLLYLIFLTVSGKTNIRRVFNIYECQLTQIETKLHILGIFNFQNLEISICKTYCGLVLFSCKVEFFLCSLMKY